MTPPPCAGMWQCCLGRPLQEFLSPPEGNVKAECLSCHHPLSGLLLGKFQNIIYHMKNMPLLHLPPVHNLCQVDEGPTPLNQNFAERSILPATFFLKYLQKLF